MADGPPHTHLTPPRAAALILRFITRGRAMAAMIGDLDEEYAARAHGSPDRSAQGSAQRWYWRQTALSAAHLAIAEVRRPAFQSTIVGLGLAYLLLQVWTLWVAPGAAQRFYLWTDGGSYTPARIVYFAVAVIGAGVAGAVFARFAPRSLANRFLTKRAAPAALLVFAPALIQIVTSGADYPVLFRLGQVSLSVAAFIAGAVIYMGLKDRRR